MLPGENTKNEFSIYIPTFYPGLGTVGNDFPEAPEYTQDVDDFCSCFSRLELPVEQGFRLLDRRVFPTSELPDSVRKEIVARGLRPKFDVWIRLSFEFAKDDPAAFIHRFIWDIDQSIRLFLISCLLARPHASYNCTSDAFITVNDSFYGMASALWAETGERVHQTDQNIGWPEVQRLDLWETWVWMQSKSGFATGISETKVERAVAAYTRLFRHGFSLGVTESDLIWSLIGLEAIFTDGGSGVQRQLFERAFLVLGKPEKFGSKIRDIYQKRSRLLHGQLNMSGSFAVNDMESEAVKKSMDLFDTEALAVTMLISALQYLAIRKLDKIEFELVLKAVSTV